MNTTTEKKTKRMRRSYSAKEKGSALLAVWSGRRRPARVCREMGINWGVFNSWEKRAIRGMREALGETPGKPETQVPGVVRLGKRLETLLGEPGPVKPEPVTVVVAETKEKE